MSDPVKIAKGLSKAQRDFLLGLPQYAVDTYPPAKWLEFKGLAVWVGNRFHPTDLGLAVRDILKETPDA